MFDGISVSQRLALVIFGTNSSGKTTFIHQLLRIDNILPADIGPVTARIVEFTYAPIEQAGFRVYLTIQKDQIESEGDLSAFFVDPAKPDWNGIVRALAVHVQRPADMEENSPEFYKWAERLVEVRLPSEVLGWGIDVYDTPGFLSEHREEALSKNVHELVKNIQPTLLFLYDNAAINQTEGNCFLAMKNALGSLGRVPIFFLVTKADCRAIANDFHLDDDPDEVTLEDFAEAVAKKRQTCYDLLRRRAEMASEVLGSLPVKVDDCSSFDIFTAPLKSGLWKEHTQLINTNCTRRIVHFAVEAFSAASRTISRDILAIVDNFFAVVSATTQRTTDQWMTLRDDALDWGKRFFTEYKELIPVLIDELLKQIHQLLAANNEEIVEQAADLKRGDETLDRQLEDKRKRVRDCIRLAVQEKIIKVAVNQVIIEKGNEVKRKLTPYFDQQRGVRRNELLEVAQRQVLSEINAGTLSDKSNFYLLLDNMLKIPLILGRFWRSVPVRWSDTLKKRYNAITYDEVTSSRDGTFRFLDALDAYGKLSSKENRRIFAQRYLTAAADHLRGQKSQFTLNLTQWLESQDQAFQANILKNYEYITAHYPKQWRLSDQLEKYSASFARIECQLLAALHLAEHKGLRPALGEPIGRGGFYSIHAAEWGKENNLAVKKLIEPTAEHLEMMAFEVLYHRAVPDLEGIAPFLSVYEHTRTDDQREFWLIMPRYAMSLQEYLKTNVSTMSFKRTISFAVTVARTLSELHRCEIAHRGLKTSNIMLDANERCFLVDFGTAKSGLLNQTVTLAPRILAANTRRSDDVHYYDETATDMYAFGYVLYEMLPKSTYQRLTVEMLPRIKDGLGSEDNWDGISKAYKALTIACLDHNPDKRPHAAELLSRLQAIQEKAEMKL